MCYNMDELWKHDAKWKKADTKVTQFQSHCVSPDRGKPIEVKVNPEVKSRLVVAYSWGGGE